MGNTLETTRKGPGFKILSLQLRHVPGASGSRGWPHPYYSGVPAREAQNPQWAPQTSISPPVSIPYSYFSSLTPLPTPGFLPDEPSNPRARLFPLAFLYQLKPQGPWAGDMTCVGLEGWLQVHLPPSL